MKRYFLMLLPTLLLPLASCELYDAAFFAGACNVDADCPEPGAQCVQQQCKVFHKDPPATGTWVHIPAGHFMMGCDFVELGCQLTESQHRVDVPEFSIMTTEITNREFVVFINENSNICEDYECSQEASASRHISYVNDTQTWQVDSGYDEMPAIATWYGADAYCQSLGGRLPSEAEWEYAARAGTTTRYYCGDEPVCLYDVAWYGSNAQGEVHQVGTKLPNAFGLYDMLGNASEWVQDCWHDDYSGAPPDGSAWLEPCNSEYKVWRGGGWNDIPSDRDFDFLRSAARSFADPEDGSNEGIRCVKDLQ